MAANESYLSNNHFGYDFVVATTQASINATMKAFLAKLDDPVTHVCMVNNEQDVPVLVSYDEVLKATGVDPFEIPDGVDVNKDARIQKLLDFDFVVGFLARPGIPKGFANPTKIPDLVILGSNTARVTFNMLCSQFEIVELKFSRKKGPSWNHVSQAKGDVWTITSSVDLRLSTVDNSAYSKLPADVQKAIKNLGGQAFSIRQLMFDFTNAGLSAPPKVVGVESGTIPYQMLNQFFVTRYFEEVQKQGQPIIGVAVTQNNTPTGTLTMTDMNMNVCPYVGTNGQPVVNPAPDQERMATLNYLCAVDHNNLPPAVRFNWNWVDLNEAADFHGVIAINRNTFANWFKDQLQSYVEGNCYKPFVRLYLDIIGIPLLAGAKEVMRCECNMTPNQRSNITFPNSGDVVLSFTYADRANSSLHGRGELSLEPKFNLDVSFKGNSIVIVQHLVIHLYSSGKWNIGTEGNVVDKKITNTYTLSVIADGRLSVNSESPIQEDRSQDPSVSGVENLFAGDINKTVADIKNWSQSLTSYNLHGIPINLLQDFIFPGGRTFAFKTVHFSDHQDIVAHITYVDPV